MRRNVYLNEKTFLLLLFLQAISIKKAFNSYFSPPGEEKQMESKNVLWIPVLGKFFTYMTLTC